MCAKRPVSTPDRAPASAPRPPCLADPAPVPGRPGVRDADVLARDAPHRGVPHGRARARGTGRRPSPASSMGAGDGNGATSPGELSTGGTSRPGGATPAGGASVHRPSARRGTRAGRTGVGASCASRGAVLRRVGPNGDGARGCTGGHPDGAGRDGPPPAGSSSGRTAARRTRAVGRQNGGDGLSRGAAGSRRWRTGRPRSGPGSTGGRDARRQNSLSSSGISTGSSSAARVHSTISGHSRMRAQ